MILYLFSDLEHLKVKGRWRRTRTVVVILPLINGLGCDVNE